MSEEISEAILISLPPVLAPEHKEEGIVLGSPESLAPYQLVCFLQFLFLGQGS